MDRPLRIVACRHITDELNGPPLGLRMTHGGPQDYLRPSRSSPANSSDRFRPVHRRTPEGGAGNAHRSEAEAVDLDIAADEPDLRASSLAIVRGPTGLTRAIWKPLLSHSLVRRTGARGSPNQFALAAPFSALLAASIAL